MKIQEILSQSRRDFYAVFVCEGCGATRTQGGYDDTYYHKEVIPTMRCHECGKTGAECGADYRPLTPKYPEGFQI